MPTKFKDRETSLEIKGRPGELRTSAHVIIATEHDNKWQFVQGPQQAETVSPGFSITVFTPMHSVKFNETLWAKLDQLSARTPDPVVDEDDEL
jgi:hypothetical protein